MKKTLVALAALVATGAFAQSTVTISGNMHFAVGTTKFGTAKSGIQIARNTGNLQFAGTEDLGGGMKAGFTVQTTLGQNAATNVDTAVPGQKTILGDRASNVTISGGFGTIGVGRGNTGIRNLLGGYFYSDQAAVTIGAMSGGTAAAATSKGTAAVGDVYTAGGSLTIGGGDANARTLYGDTFVNAVSYATPVMGGFQVAVGYAPVQGVDTGIGDSVTTKDTLSISATYNAGPIAVGYNLTDANGGAAPYSANTIAGSYDMGVAKIGLAYQMIKLDTGTSPGNGLAISVGIPMGAGVIGLGYGERGAKVQTGTTWGDDVSQYYAGYRYNLSKRTNIQAVFAKLNRAGGSATDVTETHLVFAHYF